MRSPPIVRNSAAVVFCCGHRLSNDESPHHWMAAMWLARAGVEVEVLSRGTPGRFRMATPMVSLDVCQLGESHSAFQMNLLSQLRRRRAVDNSVIYLSGHQVGPAAALGLAGVPPGRIIYHTQDFLEPGRHPVWEFFERSMARRAGAVISNEPNRARALASFYGLRQPPLIVPTLLPRDWPTPKPNMKLRNELLRRAGTHGSVDAKLVMHQGAFARVRCGEALVRAIALLPRNYFLVFTNMPPDCESTKDLQNIAQSLGVNERLILLDRMPFGEMQRFTAVCEVGILLYPNDGIGNHYQSPGRLTQYLTCGVPVLMSNSPGFELLSLKYGLGALVDPGSPQAIADGLRELAELSPAERGDRSLYLKRLAKAELSYDRHGPKVLQAFRDAAGSAQSHKVAS